MRLFALLLLCLPTALSDDPVTAYFDDFHDVRGFYSTNTNGEYQDSFDERTRELHSYMGGGFEGGYLEVNVLEDRKRKGPDDKPGVIALSFEVVPESAGHSGFLYKGRQADPIRLKGLKVPAQKEDLERVTVNFQYKAVNLTKEHIGATVNCRFEPDIDDPYNHRIDFGELKATENWQTFSRTLKDGENREEFLRIINSDKQAAFKLVWSQQGKISNYQDGDTILIDNLKITVKQK